MRTVTLFLLVCLPLVAAEPENILRNGSFEGSTLYWHNVSAKEHRLVKGDAEFGNYKLRLEKGYVMSAPFAIPRGSEFTLTFSVKGDKPGSMYVQLPPSAREDGQKAKRLWTKEASQSAKVTTEWQRVSFTGQANVPPSGFWPLSHYMALIAADGSTPIEIDGVSVQVGAADITLYEPRREVEILTECLDLPGFVEHNNFLRQDQEVRLAAHVSNTSFQTKNCVIRWEWFDYEGVRSWGEPLDRQITLEPNSTVSEIATRKLPAKGCVLARCSVLVDGKPIDSSEIPLTSLPYPKAATKPDWREKFGGSFAGGKPCVQRFQQLGFGWIRWRPHMNWADHQPQGPDKWTWFDEILDEQESLGCSTHCVMYGKPKWAFDKDNPLPKDMQWKASDPRWQDLTLMTAWDKFVKTAVEHYRGRSLVYEIENEPELDDWDKHREEYAQFTIRTARLIKHVDPQAKVMVDNVYGIPSGLNSVFLKAGGAKYIDIFSWHDYHAGWLADAASIKRMRNNLDEAGGKHVEIWFNEGWAYTNTAVDEPIACTHLTSVGSTNAMVACVAELTATGQDKTILFHTSYANHGMSFWDYSGPGTMLWDWYDNPLPLAAAWNTLAHHIGISERIGWVRPPGANYAIFQDERNGRGVIIAYADRGVKEDVVVNLPLNDLIAEDCMGNAVNLQGNKLTLSQSGRAVFLYDAHKTAGKDFLTALERLDRKHGGFVTNGEKPVYRLPAIWEGEKKGEAAGNPLLFDKQPIWRLDRLFPREFIKTENYQPLVWGNGTWVATDHSQGGHPSATIADGNVSFGTMGPWGGGKVEFPKTPVLAFIAPASNVYRIRGTARCKPWDGGAKTYRLLVLKKDTQRAVEVKTFELPRTNEPVKIDLQVELTAGHELLFVPLVNDYHNAATVRLENLEISE